MQSSDVYFDPSDVEIHRDPYATYQRLRDEAPLYYNDRHDFYAVSRYDDVERGLADRDTFTSGRGNVLEFISANGHTSLAANLRRTPRRCLQFRRLVGERLHPVEIALGLQLVEVRQDSDHVVRQQPGQIGGEALPHHDAQHRDVGGVVRHGVCGHLPAVGTQRMRYVELGIAGITVSR